MRRVEYCITLNGYFLFAGVVTGVSAGTATITVTTTGGGKTATCTVTVTAAPAVPAVLSVTVSPDAVSRATTNQNSFSLTATINAVPGVYTITATSTFNSTKKGTSTITLY